MKPISFKFAAVALTVVSPTIFVAPAYAQGVGTDNQLTPIEIVGSKPTPLNPNLPSNSASRTEQQLESQNIFNAEDAFRYMPSTTVRKRYFGDRNANVGGRSHGVLEPGRSLVYLDGYLISQFLGRFDAPRWNMVNNESIERIDVLYGPFSAIYPGNSIGTTLSVTERKPKGFEASASIKLNTQRFSEYSTTENYTGLIASARIASRLNNGFWYSVSAQHQNVTGHPMGYANTLSTTAGQFGAANLGTRVTGVLRDVSPDGVDRALFAANGIDTTKQDSLNLRMGYAISKNQEIDFRASVWRNDSTVRVENYLTSAATGLPVWSGIINDGVNSFNLNNLSSQFSPSKRDEENRQLGLTWKTKFNKGWDASLVMTQFKVLQDINRATSLIQPAANNGGVGTVTRRDGTGWNTFEVQATYTPQEGDFGNGNHALSLGYHQNQYKLNNSVRDSSDWRNNETTPNQRYSGQTGVAALYAQDAWQATPNVLVTYGLRYERFEQKDGYQFDKTLAIANQNVYYPSRSLNATSPKLSVVWAAFDDVQLKASAGKGTRFPNVDEMYNGTKTSTNILINNPTLRPEVSTAFELSAVRYWSQGSVRASLFRDDVQDAILRQSDTSVSPTTTRNTNVQRVLSQGIELYAQAKDLWVKGLDLSGSATWTNAQIKENALAPATVGKNWLRVPKQRYTLQVNYRPNAQWNFGANYRWAGRNYNTAPNTDINPETYGGISHVNQLDVSARWEFANDWVWAVGIDNLNKKTSWQSHTMPQRSFQTELRYNLR
jgi:iron complex outermembrane recepter protein